MDRGNKMNETKEKTGLRFKKGDKVKVNWEETPFFNMYEEIATVVGKSPIKGTYEVELVCPGYSNSTLSFKPEALTLVSFEIQEEDWEEGVTGRGNVQQPAKNHDTRDVNGIELKVGDTVKVLIDEAGDVKEGEILVIKSLDYNSGLNTLDFEDFDYSLYPSEVEKMPSLRYNPDEVAFSKRKYWTILEECTGIAKERETQYASVEENYENILGILNQISVKQFTNEDINKVMLAVKLGRMKFDNTKKDNYLDAINYLAIDLHLKEIKNQERCIE